MTHEEIIALNVALRDFPFSSDAHRWTHVLNRISARNCEQYQALGKTSGQWGEGGGVVTLGFETCFYEAVNRNSMTILRVEAIGRRELSHVWQ